MPFGYVGLTSVVNRNWNVPPGCVGNNFILKTPATYYLIFFIWVMLPTNFVMSANNSIRRGFRSNIDKSSSYLCHKFRKDLLRNSWPHKNWSPGKSSVAKETCLALDFPRSWLDNNLLNATSSLRSDVLRWLRVSVRLGFQLSNKLGRLQAIDIAFALSKHH